MSAKDAIMLYKSRNASEKIFREDKTYLGNRSLRMQSTESVGAKIFIEFVALQNYFYCNCEYLNRHNSENSKVSGCLYTGDYEISNEECENLLFKAYKNYLDDIGCFQIPHHGAQNCLNNEIIERFPMQPFYIISVGETNKFGHSDESVINKLSMKKCRYFIVGNHKASQANFFIYNSEEPFSKYP